ncbi:probable G-protein coupled receptor 139 [Heterodontus francisci]
MIDMLLSNSCLQEWSEEVRPEAKTATSDLLIECANLLTIVILSRGKCGLSKCISRYMVAMTTADLLVLIFDVILYEIKEMYFTNSFLDYTFICRLQFTFSFISIDCSVWLTVAFSFDRFVSICYQKLRNKYCTEKTALVVIAAVCGLSVLKNIPFYFVNKPGIMIDNIPWFCIVKSAFYILPVWMAYLWLNTILTPLAAFFLILFFNALTIRHIVVTNRVRRGFREKSKDPEIESRRKSIILLLAISGSFILLWILISICDFSVQFTENQFYQSDYNDPFTIMEQTGFMLQRLSSCTNTVIYAVVQTKFRDELKNIIKYPFTRMIKLSITLSSSHQITTLSFTLSHFVYMERRSISRIENIV